MTDAPFDPVPGVPEVLQPGLRRILAPNPSPMTFRGTNTYLIGRDNVAVIDPGPNLAAHHTAIAAALGTATLTHIFVTHSHVDHSPLAAPLSKATGAPIIAFGDSTTGQSRVMRHLADAGLTGGGEGIDRAFRPDVCLDDGDAIDGKEWQIHAHHTPGHMGNHMSFAWKDVVFTGDLVMGWASSMVSPPDGDLTDFMGSCRKLKGINATTFYPGHGAPIADPQARLAWLLDHRDRRTAQIINTLKTGALSVAELTQMIYTDAPAGLLQAAARNVFAHLIDLHEKGRVRAAPTLSTDAIYSLAGTS